MPHVNGSVDLSEASIEGDPIAPKLHYGVCRVEVVADSTYFQHDCLSDHMLCTAKLVKVIRYADDFYRRQSFGSDTHVGIAFIPIHIHVIERNDNDPLEGSVRGNFVSMSQTHAGEYADSCLQVWMSHRDWGDAKGASHIGDNCRNFKQPHMCAACRASLSTGAPDVLIGLCGYRFKTNRVLMSTFKLEGKLECIDYGGPCNRGVSVFYFL